MGDKTIKEQDILNRINLLGDVFVYAKHLDGSSTFVIELRYGADYKIGTLTGSLKPAEVENIIFASYRPITTRIHRSDLDVMKCLLSDPRMLGEDIAKEDSLSSKTTTRRLENTIENHILQFSILTNLSSMQLLATTCIFYLTYWSILYIISYNLKVDKKANWETERYYYLLTNNCCVF
jgi:hypothetical protein